MTINTNQLAQQLAEAIRRKSPSVKRISLSQFEITSNGVKTIFQRSLGAGRSFTPGTVRRR